ncbi:MAG: Crp/Fnr family transcriptional regulator [Pseudomonadota bacterium]|nr:Crp/Fnr family transcriptional regulator [Pseudomonadota bacterium]
MIESHPLGPLAHRWSKLASVTPEDCSALLELPYTVRTFGKEAYLVRQGQQANECMLLLSGFAYRQKLLRNGSRQIISIHIPTEFVDLQNSLLGVADHNVQSLNGCEAAIIPRRALMELQEARPAVRMAMWIETLIDSSIFREWVVNVGRRDSKARIAHLLCELAIRLKRIGDGREWTFEFPLTQEQLADATGQTPVHTNRTLQALRKEGLIQLTARSLKILDWEGLREAGDFDELYLHQQAQLNLASSGAGRS